MIDQRAREHFIDYCIAIDKNWQTNWHHEIIAKELEAAENGTATWKILIIQIPPRHGKSTEATIYFPTWYLGRNPEREIITVSYSEDLAVKFGGRARDIIGKSSYKRIFGNVRLRQDEKAKARWTTNSGGGYISVGIGGALTGHGADLLIIDDPLKNRKEADSGIIRENQWEFFISTAYTRLEPGGRAIIITTRWHLDDLAGRIQASPEFKEKTLVISFPAISVKDEEFRKAGEALWPARYPLRELESIKKGLGPYEFQALYQQHPILTANQEFKQNWIRHRIATEVDFQDTRKFLTIDTAISKKDTADYTGFCDNAVDKFDNWNFRAWRMRLGPKELIDILFLLYEKRGYEKIGIEKTIYLMVFEPFLRDEMIKRGKYLPIYELEHKETHKETRIRALIPRYATGKIYHIADECEDLEEEMLTFPKGLHDDTLDAAAYQIQIAEKGRTEEVQQTQILSEKSKENIYDGI